MVTVRKQTRITTLDCVYWGPDSCHLKCESVLPPYGRWWFFQASPSLHSIAHFFWNFSISLWCRSPYVKVTKSHRMCTAFTALEQRAAWRGSSFSFARGRHWSKLANFFIVPSRMTVCPHKESNQNNFISSVLSGYAHRHNTGLESLKFFMQNYILNKRNQFPPGFTIYTPMLQHLYQIWYLRKRYRWSMYI